MSEQFVWPSDRARAENDELNRVCEYAEQLHDELQAARTQRAPTTQGAKAKVDQMGGKVVGVLAENEAGALAAVHDLGRVTWLDDCVVGPVDKSEPKPYEFNGCQVAKFDEFGRAICEGNPELKVGDWLFPKKASSAQQAGSGEAVSDALKAMERYKKSYDEIYTLLGQFLDAEEGEGYTVNLDEAWMAFNQAPGPVFWEKISSALNSTHPQPAQQGSVPEGWKVKIAELCAAVENEEDLPPVKFALRCGRLINEVRNLLATPQLEGDGWKPYYDHPETGKPVLGYHRDWVDEDFCKDGIRECFTFGDGSEWQSARWDGYSDQWIVEDGTPEFWQSHPNPPAEQEGKGDER